MKKRIAIVGAGAVGGYIGGYLTRDGFDVTLIDAWPQHIEAIRSHGLKLDGDTQADRFTVRCETLHISEVQGLSKQRPIDIAIVAVKSYDTTWATQLILPYLSEQGYVVSAQNSINEEAIAAVAGWGRTVGCILGGQFAVDLYEAGCIRRNMVRDTSIASLQVGEAHGRITPRVEELAAMLKSVDGSAATRNLWGGRWSKLCLNGMRNGPSAATGMSGNERDGHDIIRKVVIRLGGEAVRVGLALGYELEPIAKVEPLDLLAASEGDPAALARVEAIILDPIRKGIRSDLQRPSMGQDMAKGRRTEIDYISGLVARKAAEAGLAAPTHAAVTEIVKQVERGELPPRPENLFHLA